MITGKTKVYGLIGNPVAQSFSPFIHNTLAEKLGMDMTYVTFPVEKKDLKSAYLGLRALGIHGVNVTVPYKSDIMEMIDRVDAEAANIGAVNTLVQSAEAVKGFNTDWIGLWRSLKRSGIELKEQGILIIGAGGSARAAAVMCAKAGARSVTIANRTVSKAERIAGLLEERYKMASQAIGIEDIRNQGALDVVIQTTPLGMYPKVNGCPIDDFSLLDQVDVVVDLIYNPEETVMLRKAKEAGCQTLNGLEMLFYQAVEAFQLWHDLVVPDDVQEMCLSEFKDALREKNKD